MAYIDFDEHLRQIWLLYVIVFFLHGVADPVITHIGVNVLNVAVEFNPLFRETVEAGAFPFAISFIPLYLISGFCLAALTVLYQRSDDDERVKLYWVSVVVLLFCIIWGILLVGWNLLVIVTGL